MIAAHGNPDSSRARMPATAQGSGNDRDLEIARRIALEMLEADHWALELEPPGATPSCTPAGLRSERAIHTFAEFDNSRSAFR